VQSVELCPWKLTSPHFIHTGCVSGAPPVRKAGPIDIYTFSFAPGLTFFDDGASPIYNRSERVEDQRLGHHIQFCLLNDRNEFHDRPHT
jgi:hypothetical protein